MQVQNSVFALHLLKIGLIFIRFIANIIWSCQSTVSPQESDVEMIDGQLKSIKVI